MRKKRVWLKSIFLFLLALSMSACKETPEENVVGLKDQAVLESKISESESAENAASEQSSFEWKEQQYTDSFAGADENVWIDVNANFRYIENASPVIRIRPHRITGEEVRQWAEVLVSADFYYEQKTELSKAELENLILQLRQALGSEEYWAQYDGEPEAEETARKTLEEQLAKYEEEYQTADEEIARTETDWLFHPSSYYDTWSILSVEENMDSADVDERLLVEADKGELKAYVNAYNYCYGDYYDNLLEYRLYNSSDENGNAIWDSEQEEPMTLSENEVIEMVSDQLSEIGLGHMQLYSCRAYGKVEASSNARKRVTEAEEDVYSYSLIWLPSYEEIPVSYQKNILEYGEESYGALYNYEKVQVSVRNDQIVVLVWQAPTELVKVENRNTATLSIEEILQIFKQQMQLQYTLERLSRYSSANADYNEVVSKLKEGRIYIDQIDYGYVRIQIPDNFEEFRLVPAWCFWGVEALDSGEGLLWPEDTEAFNERNLYLAVNAVDGTIINTGLGY